MKKQLPSIIMALCGLLLMIAAICSCTDKEQVRRNEDAGKCAALCLVPCSISCLLGAQLPNEREAIKPFLRSEEGAKISGACFARCGIDCTAKCAPAILPPASRPAS